MHRTGPTMSLGFRLSTRELGFVGVMTGLCVALNYAMLGLINVKLMDLFVFVSGYLMGPLVGVLVGSLTWLVYGTLNPWGFSLPIFFATMFGESLYGIAGGLAFRFGLVKPPNSQGLSPSKRGFWILNLKFAVLGFLLTFAYDLLTNVVLGLVVGIPIVVAIMAGVLFALVHEASNFLFFFFGASVMINTVRVFIARTEVR